MSTSDSLRGKQALVTGSSRGIGRATALALAAKGATVIVHSSQRREDALKVVSQVEEMGGAAVPVVADLSMPAGVEALFEQIAKALPDDVVNNTARIDVLVNNAGIMGGLPWQDTTPELFDQLVAVNAKAPFFVMMRALQNMPEGGRIINISSGLTRFANPDEVAYAMSKGAVEMLALHMAKALGPRGITVNSVAPGITRNDNPVFGMPEVVDQMAGLSTFGRVGEPEDVADVVAFLASPEARWVTGSFQDATGGTLLG